MLTFLFFLLGPEFVWLSDEMSPRKRGHAHLHAHTNTLTLTHNFAVISKVHHQPQFKNHCCTPCDPHKGDRARNKGVLREDNKRFEDVNEDQVPKFFCQIFSLLEYIISQREWHILKLNVLKIPQNGNMLRGKKIEKILN